MRKRSIYQSLISRLREPRRHIQVLLGPRQVGKTTLILQVTESLGLPSHYVSADLAGLQDITWLRQQWESARRLLVKNGQALLIVDEVQKIPHWLDAIKALWDQDSRSGANLSVVLLGSSPWLMQRGLSESLAGRFEILPITHWSFDEMERHFAWSLDQYLYFGAYPGTATLADELAPSRWSNYINDSLIETTISRDILLMTQVNKPALLRRLFQLGCIYSGQILSYTKILGQLQDAGNTTTLAHYLDLLSGAGLLGGIPKFFQQPVKRKGSSPKFCVFNTALMTAQTGKTFREAMGNHDFRGRLVESAVGAYLLNSIRGTQIELFYWNEGDREVDFILKRGDFVTAIEVKSGRSRKNIGMAEFVRKFNPKKTLLVGDEGIPLAEFLRTAIQDWTS